MTNTAIIILAAGNSSRLGRHKQLLPYQGKTLLTHIANEALNAALHSVTVVTGAFHAEIIPVLHSLADSRSDLSPRQKADIVYNEHWEKGMASGIVAGLSKTLSLHPDTDAAIIAVCDQPYISAALFRQLSDNHSFSGKGIIACAYSDTMGTPVLFDRKYFGELSSLSGSQGAKRLLRQHPADLATIPFPQGDVDIDTEEDLQRL